MDVRMRNHERLGGVLLARGFTLVELLTVMVIIGLLMGMISVAVIAARARAKIAATGIEIAGLESALHDYRARFNEYPPDFAFVRTGGPGSTSTMAKAAVVQHLSRMFPRFVIPGTNPNAQWSNLYSMVYSSTRLNINQLDPATALVFWLGGVPERNSSTGQATGRLMGFSANPSNPFDSTTASRIGPFFDFDATRLEATSSGWLRYKPSYGAGPSGPPYVYFRSPYYYMNGNQIEPCTWPRVTPSYGAEQEELGTSQTSRVRPVSVRPYYNWSTDGKVRVWYNPTGIQILCAGADNRYGGIAEDIGGSSTAIKAPHFPLSDNLVGGHDDNQTNFCRGVLQDLLK
jgi:prepilin-type N-terminal cleavage/methylation domain-containing protein